MAESIPRVFIGTRMSVPLHAEIIGLMDEIGATQTETVILLLRAGLKAREQFGNGFDFRMFVHQAVVDGLVP